MNNESQFISVKGLFKSYQSGKSVVNILSGADLFIQQGESLAVIGASGVGKSTLLHVMGTIDRPDRGEIRYEGKDVFTYNDQQLARFRNSSIGFVFQFHHLLSEFNALENVMMPALVSGMDYKDATPLAEAILARVGLSSRLSHRIGELSGGEQQRVAIARALVLQPKIVLADEPTGNLDIKTGKTIHDLLAYLNKELGVTLIVATHSMELAALMGRRITLVDGKIEEAMN
ncbi:MAG: ABC transporter ATP-binding protein [Pseudomonadota bacterium]